MTRAWLFDHVCRPERPHPNIAEHRAEPYTPEWRQFSQIWPRSEPVGFYEHCWELGVPVAAHTLGTLGDQPAIYPIAVSFFDHEINYLQRIPQPVQDLVRSGQVRVVLFYSEGDDPRIIRELLTQQEISVGLPTHSTHIVSANTAAESVVNAHYFADDEILYRRRNRWHPALEYRSGSRPWQFTCLSRTHKWWRLATITEIMRRGWLDQAIWSYNTLTDCGDRLADCPIDLSAWPDLADDMTRVWMGGPYRADILDSDQHNDHEHLVPEHFLLSYFQVIMETHFDADGSGGAFITEKTFKAIKHGQPFVIFGAPGTLAQLRRMGYDTFDSAIDNHYDTIIDNDLRWAAVLEALGGILAQGDLGAWMAQCRAGIQHNQALFQGDLRPRLNSVLERLYSHADHQ